MFAVTDKRTEAKKHSNHRFLHFRIYTFYQGLKMITLHQKMLNIKANNIAHKFSTIIMEVALFFFLLILMWLHKQGNQEGNRRAPAHQWLKSHHMSNTSRRTASFRPSETSCTDLKGETWSWHWGQHCYISMSFCTEERGKPNTQNYRVHFSE